MFRTLHTRGEGKTSPVAENNSTSADLDLTLPRLSLIDRSATANSGRLGIMDGKMSQMESSISRSIAMKLKEQRMELEQEQMKLDDAKKAQHKAAVEKYNAASGDMVNKVISALRAYRDRVRGADGAVPWDSLGEHPLKTWAEKALEDEPDLLKLLYHVDTNVSVSNAVCAQATGGPACTAAVVNVGSLAETLKKNPKGVPVGLGCANSIRAVSQLHSGVVQPEKIRDLHSGDSTFLLLAAAARERRGFQNTGLSAILCGIPIEHVTHNGTLRVPPVGSCQSEKVKDNHVFYTDFVGFSTDLPVWDEQRHALTGQLIFEDIDKEKLEKIVASRLGDANPTHLGLSDREQQQATEIHASIQQCRTIADMARAIGKRVYKNLPNSDNYEGPIIDLSKIAHEVQQQENAVAVSRDRLDRLLSDVEDMTEQLKKASEMMEGDSTSINTDEVRRETEMIQRMVDIRKIEVENCKNFLTTATAEYEKRAAMQEQVRTLAQFFCMMWKSFEVASSDIAVYAGSNDEVIRYVQTHDSNQERDNAMVDKLSLPASSEDLEQLAMYAENLQMGLKLEHDNILVSNQVWVGEKDSSDVSHDADVRRSARSMAHPISGNSLLQLLNFHVAPSGVPLHEVKTLHSDAAFHNAFIRDTEECMASFNANYLVLRIPAPKKEKAEMDESIAAYPTAGRMGGHAHGHAHGHHKNGHVKATYAKTRAPIL